MFAEFLLVAKGANLPADGSVLFSFKERSAVMPFTAMVLTAQTTFQPEPGVFTCLPKP
jgi:hypothetical protein